MKAVGYVRSSTMVRVNHRSSVDIQERDIRALAAHRGLVLTGVYHEFGSDFMEHPRPALTRLLEDARQVGRAFDIVLVTDYSRLARDQITLAHLRRELEDLGVRVERLQS